jgi:hypothetical protein
MASHQYHLPRVIAIDLAALATIAAQVLPRRAGVTHGYLPEAALGQGVLGGNIPVDKLAQHPYTRA